ncbi:unnamed protein product [Allacma fusca]|uniref:Uncharacterized protein n=1 Tax=Allacma fusca TaxID=39272 RepID=A0A8J2K233_9HEXA|nr:unnamed protein product [Allacma fusca]
MATDEINKKYYDMVETFKKNVAESLKNQTNAWNELLQSGQKNFVDLQQYYGKGHQELLNQMKKANTEMLEKLTKNYQDLRESLQNNYNNLMQQSATNLNKNLDQFKTNCEEAMKKVPALSPKTYQDAMSELKAMHGKTSESIQKAFTTLIEHMDKSFRDTIKQLQLPEVKNKTPPRTDVKK